MFRTNNRLGIKTSSKGGKLISHPRQKEQSSLLVGGDSSGGASMSMSAIGSSQRENKDLFLTGIVNDKQKSTMRLFFKDMYTYDSICGSTIDLTATLPFSDFSLRGAPAAQLDVYNSSLEQMDLKNRNSSFAANILTYGEMAATLVYSKKDKMFVDILEYDLNQCDMRYLPFSSMEPLITVSANKEFSDFLSSDDEYLRKLRTHIPQTLIDSMSEGQFTLDPLTTLYLSRTPISKNEPVSYLQRVLPVYLLEKALYRGTLTEAYKRQRAFFHVAMGVQDVWEPTAEELNTMAGVIQRTELDPLGAVVVTRDGVQMNETRGGGEFWKWTDIVDICSMMKMRALATSESFLSADASFGTAEVGLTVFMESLKAFRQNYTQKVFYNKVFPTIATVNGFYESGGRRSGEEKRQELKDPSRLVIPELHWHKALEPLNDEKAMEIMQVLEDKGVPIPIRAHATAGGMDLDDFFNDLDNDVEDRKKIAEYLKKVEAIGGEGSGDEDDYEDFETASAKYNSLQIKPKSILHRDFGEAAEVVGYTRTGKKKYVHNQKQANEKFRDATIAALRRLRDKSHYASTVKKAKSKNLIKPGGF